MIDHKKHPWVQALSLTEDDLSSWDGKLLSTLFLNEVLSEEKYLSWAHNFYQIPQIDRDFFYYSFDHKKIEKYIQLGKELWDQEFYPIYIWNDVLFIACLYPQNISIEGVKTCFVLSPPQALKHLWNNKVEGLVNKPNELKVAPEGLFNADDLISEMNFGFNESTKVKKEDKEATQVVPEKIDLSKVAPISAKNEPIKITPQAAPEELTDSKPISEINYMGTENIRMLDDLLLNESKDHVQDCESIEDGVLSIMKKTKGFFRKMLWLSPSTNSYQAKLSWGNWDFDETKAGSEVNLDQPNPFRIVHNTKLPYHGPLFMNAANQNYMDWWNGGKSLDHLTIQPVVINGECFGCLVGADKGREFDNDIVLKQMDRLSKRLADNIEKILRQKNKVS